MIVTDHFILINFPKTGSTFARVAIKELYEKRRNNNKLAYRLLRRLIIGNVPEIQELYLPKTEFKNGYNSGIDQHGRYEQVPEKLRNRPVLSVARDPVERNISFYEYGWWKKYPVAHLEEIRRKFPKYPELDFRTYLEYQNFNTRFRDTGIHIPGDIGNQTVHFIQFFFKEPKNTFKKLNDDYIYSGEYKNDIPIITLLRTETLNVDLCNYLINIGFSKDDVKFIREKSPVRPEHTKRKSEFQRKEYLTQSIEQAIRKKERYLYKIYSDHGIRY